MELTENCLKKEKIITSSIIVGYIMDSTAMMETAGNLQANWVMAVFLRHYKTEKSETRVNVLASGRRIIGFSRNLISDYLKIRTLINPQ